MAVFSDFHETRGNSLEGTLPWICFQFGNESETLVSGNSYALDAASVAADVISIRMCIQRRPWLFFNYIRINDFVHFHLNKWRILFHRCSDYHEIIIIMAEGPETFTFRTQIMKNVNWICCANSCRFSNRIFSNNKIKVRSPSTSKEMCSSNSYLFHPSLHFLCHCLLPLIYTMKSSSDNCPSPHIITL